MATVEYGNLLFDEAIDFFKQKINMSTETYQDVWRGQHARAFTVAGATKADILCDFRAAVDKAISEGTTLAEFKKDFNGIVKKHGWSYKGKPGWRSSVIYHTNVRTAYSTGRYKQMTDKETVKRRPYWIYRHGHSVRPRVEHLAWDGLILPADDPWWGVHWPPNGWGCKCRVRSLSKRDLKRMGKDGPDKAPNDGVYEWKDNAGKTHKIENGIDPGWDYNPGVASYGDQLGSRQYDAKRWKRLTEGDYKTAGRPDRAPADQTKAAVDYAIPKTKRGMKEALTNIMGGTEALYTFNAGNIRNDVLVDAKFLTEHIDKNRAPYLPLIPETLLDPYEIWAFFEEDVRTGKIALRQNIIRVFETEKDRAVMIGAQASGGVIEAWTMIPISKIGKINKKRVGKLLYGRE